MTTVVSKNSRQYLRRPEDVFIGRPSKWGNPFTHMPRRPWNGHLTHVGSRQEAVSRYRERLLQTPELMACLPELKDRRLVCYCKPQACHGDVLAELVNALP